MVDFAFALFSSRTLPPSASPPPPLNRLCSKLSAPSKTFSVNLALLSRLNVKGFPSSVSSSSLLGRSCSSTRSFIAHSVKFVYDSLHFSACPSELQWCLGFSSPAFPAAGSKTFSSGLPINLNQKMRSSFSGKLMSKGENALASLATDGCDKLLPSENGGDDDRKLNNGRPLPISDAKLLTLPTILTLGRVAAIPILLVVFYSTEWWASNAVALIFVLAAITDWLDGFIARKMGSNSTFGAFLDPVADKLMVATTLVLLSTKPLHIAWAASLPWLIPLPSTAIIGREITMSAVREWAASQGEHLQAAVAVNKLGKWKTAFQMVALTVLLATRNGSESGMVNILVSVGVGLLYISAALAIWSLFVYMKAIWGALVG